MAKITKDKNKKYTKYTINNKNNKGYWNHLSESYLDFKKKYKDEEKTWVFRGQPRTLQLKTTLERLIDNVPVFKKAELEGKIKQEEKAKQRTWRKYPPNSSYIEWIECGLLRRFQKQYLNYEKPILAPGGNFIDWFALMQHFGAPTRLLDWTYSFYVAAFNAISDFKVEEDEYEFSEVWAINLGWVEDRAYKILKELGDSSLPEKLHKKDRNLREFKTFKRLNRKKLVMPVAPYGFFERFSIQQGVFLMPGDIRESFMSNLFNLENKKDKELLEDNLIKFNISNKPEAKSDILKNLIRMNMVKATLFPGLEGFAESLESYVFSMPIQYFTSEHFYRLYSK